MASVLPDKPLFLIVDGHALIYRAYHAFPGLTDPTGRLVNAVYGFTRILLAAIRDLKPEYLAVAFDSKGLTKRAQELDAKYKAHRPPMPEDLREQVQIVKDVVDAFNIPRFELEGYEADDLIGTISRRVAEGNGVTKGVVAPNGIKTMILTGDKDLFQLIDEAVHVWLPGRGKGSYDEEIDEARVVEKLGVTALQVPELKALMGDASDNIPGVSGVGPKTAALLIQKYSDLDGVYQAVEQAKDADKATQKAAGFSPKLLEKLIEEKDVAYLSRQLATIDRESPIEFLLAPCRVVEYDKQRVMDLFTALDFKSLQYLLPKDEFELGVQKALF